MFNFIKLEYNAIDRMFFYSEDSATGLKWKSPRDHKKINTDAGYLLKNKDYYHVKVQNKAVLVHRIIMLLNGYDISNKIVDHIDGNKLNNAISNLRLVDLGLNARNRGKCASNTSGFVGVTKMRSSPITHPHRWYYAAFWSEDFKLRSKYFSVDKYGEEVAKSLAIKCRVDNLNRLNEIGYGYTDRHICESVEVGELLKSSNNQDALIELLQTEKEILCQV